MKLSIITINYNNKAGLEKTVASVMSQTWRDFEWIIIDGGSTDGSKEVIKEVAKDPLSNISYWCSEPDKGIYNAMNKGILKASGEYLNFMNSGDSFYSNTTLHHFYKFSCKIVADIYYGDVMLVKDGTKEKLTYPEFVDIHYLYKCGLNHQTTFIKRNLFVTNGYDESYKIASDYHFFLICALQNKSFVKLNRVIANYDDTGYSSSHHDSTINEINSIQEKMISSQLYDYLNASVNNYGYIRATVDVFNRFEQIKKNKIAWKLLRLYIKILPYII